MSSSILIHLFGRDVVENLKELVSKQKKQYDFASAQLKPLPPLTLYPEVGKVSLKRNGGEALSDESV
jgi:hypothetical protein